MDLRALWDFSDPSASELRFRDAAEEAAEPERSLLLTQAARALGLQSRFAEARAVLAAIAPSDPEVAVRVALEGGRLARSEGDSAAARPFFDEAAHLARGAGLEDLEIDALHMMALVLDGDEQLRATERALERARSATTPEGRGWAPSLLNNLGMAHADSGRWQQALEAFEEALSLRDRGRDAESHRVARWMVAWALRHLGRRSEALAIQRELAAYGRQNGIEDAYVDEEIALLEQDDANGGSWAPLTPGS